MPLPADFVFSQSSLQDYVDCPRRFQLRHLLRLPWPAVIAEPYLAQERRSQAGESFHLLVQRHLLGLPPESLRPAAEESDLSRWWAAYLAWAPANLPRRHQAELALCANLAGRRLLAKYDLLAWEPGRFVIVDWKTGRRRPSDGELRARLQTVVYRWLLVQAAAQFNDGSAPQPEQVEMIYWFAEHPQDPAHFPYDSAQYQADGAYLQQLACEIEQACAEVDAPLALSREQRRCLFCPYRSLCERGASAGLDEDWEGSEVTPAFDLDFEQVAEIAL